jgi:intracellular sulfur oxidation DsrE/DsrF family protein
MALSLRLTAGLLQNRRELGKRGPGLERDRSRKSGRTVPERPLDRGTLMRARRALILFGLTICCGAAALGIGAYAFGHTGETAPWVRQMEFAAYGRQQVIYHVDEGAGFFNGRFRHVLQVAQNHVNAVGADKLDLRIVMQSEGVDLLAWAKKDPTARAQVDALKAQGVKFEICRNTLIKRRIDPDRELYDVKRGDVIRTAVGEIAALEQQGFQYIKP